MIGALLTAILSVAACALVMAQEPATHRDVRPHAAQEVVRFVHSTGAYSLDHPADWQTHERGARTNIGAEDGLEATARGFRTIYGVIVAIVDDPAGKQSLEDSARAIVDNVLKGNAHQRMHTPVHADGTLAGAPAATAVIMGTSPVTGRSERAEIVCRRLGESQLLYLVLVSPGDHFATLEAPLKRVRDSVRIPAAKPAAQAKPATSKVTRLALVGGMLLSGYDLVPPLHHAAVLIEDNRIVWVGPANQAKVPPDAKVVDTSGQTMLPGLIDLHVHLMLLGHGDYARWFPWSVEYGVERVMEISARQLLMAGVTTAVDLSGPLKESLSVRDRIDRREIPGPRMWMSGPWVTLSTGRFPPEQMTVTTPEEAYAATEKLAKAGVNVIKAYPMTGAHYKKVVEAAHKHQLKVYAHVVEQNLVRTAIDAGVDVLTHPGGGDAPPYPADLVDEIVALGRPVTSTAVHRWIYPATIAFPGRLQDPQLKKDFPPEIWREVQDSFKNWQTLQYFQRADRDALFNEQRLKQLIDAGAVMGMGTDSGTPMNFHTEALWREIKIHVDMGMSPQRAISAATRVNARIMGRGAELGTIEAGKLADIIVVAGDPLSNVMALSDVRVVVKDGVVMKNDDGSDESHPTTPGLKRR